MKLIYLHQYFKFPDVRGGTRSYDLASSFLRHGYKVSVVTSTSDERYNNINRWNIVSRDGMEVHYIFIPYSNRLSYFQRMWAFSKFLWFASFRLLKIKADFVLATSTPLTIGIPALIKKWFGRTPFIFEVRDVWPEVVIAIGAVRNKFVQKCLYGLEWLIYKNARAIVPLSTDMQKSITSRYPQFATKAEVVIENISEVNRFQNVNAPVDLKEVTGFDVRFSILYAGTFGKVNGVHKVIELAEKTLNLDEQLVFLLIGDGAEKDKIRQAAIDRGVLGKNVFIFDPISKSELPDWYSSISMGSSFVIDIPELWANSANKFFDTLAAGKPILINHEGWQADMIRSREVGFVLPFEITDEVAKEFVKYTLDRKRIVEQEMKALALAKQKFSLEIASIKYLELFRNSLSK